MKTLFKLIVGMIILFGIALSCNSSDDIEQMVDDDISQNDDVDPIDDDPDGNGDPSSTEGLIVFPEGSIIDLNLATITIAGELISLNTDGTAELPTFEGATELAFLTDSDKNILLAGFISEERQQISIASTAAVLFYFASTAYLQDEGSKEEILASIEASEEYLSFVNDLESLFVQDNLVLQNMGFLPSLQASIEGLRNVNTTTSKVFVESNDIRSKIQIESTNATENSFSITNRGARRVEVFVYKKSFIDLDGNEQIVDDQINGSDTSEFPPEAIYQGNFRSNFNNATVTEGNKFALAFSCGTVFNSTSSSPLSLPLEDNEASATYEVTVIGPGQNDGERDMTTAEREAFERISTETFLLDYVLPTLFDIGGRKQAYDAIEGNSKDAALLAAAMPFFENNPQVMQLVFDGEYSEALGIFFKSVRDEGTVFQLLEDSYEVVFNDNDISGSFVFTDELTENLGKMTQIIEGITSQLSFFCTDRSIAGISKLESWELTADRGEVTLEPLRAGVQIFETDLEITAKIIGIEDDELNDGSITYEWSVSENFDSFLFDKESNRGLSFTNNSNSVRFGSYSAGSNLVDFENIETVTVRAFRDVNGTQQLIGTAEMTVNVQDRLFRISPLETILRGVEQVNLQVLNIDGSPLAETDDFEFKVVWTTSGAQALFNGNSTAETVFNDNSILLRNLDDDVENATQSVRAGIFLRPKDNPDDIPFREVAFEFINVFITNNNTIEFEVDGEGFIRNRFPETVGERIQFSAGFIVPFEERAISYRAEIIDFQFINFAGNEIGAQHIGKTYNWTNTSQGSSVGLLNESSDSPGDFGISLNGSGINTTSEAFAVTAGQYDNISGTIKITIVLEDE